MKKAPKTIFLLSFAPAALLLLAAFIALLTRGSNAFEDTIILGGFIMCMIPILPLCLIYQVLYLCKRFLPACKKLSLKHFVIIGLLLLAVFIGLSAHDFIRYRIESVLDQHNAQKLYTAADFKIDYNPQVISECGIFDIPEQKTSCILIDHDSNRIGFIVNSDLDEFYQFPLTEAQTGDPALKNIKDTDYVQEIFELQSDGRQIGRLMTFYPEPTSKHRTTAVIIEYYPATGSDNEGKTFYADPLLDENNYPIFAALSASEYFVSNQVRYHDIG